MDPNLFSAYNYLSSAIAQAFAALIAFTVMVYIYRKGMLQAELKEAVDSLRPLIEDGRGGERDTHHHVRAYSEKEVIAAAKERLSRKHWMFSEEIKEKLDQLKGLNEKSKIQILPHVTLSAIAMFAGIAALLFGPIILSDRWRFVVMIVESALAAVALGWTVVVVIRMLAEPKEPRAEEK